jgi:spermidine synthase
MPASPLFEELDYRETPIGELILRRRVVLSLDNLEVHEVILGENFLMSSMFTEVEQELARLGLAALDETQNAPTWDVVVGGLGLGYTARAALEDARVGSLFVVDFLQPVIEWHEQGLVPLGPELCADERCSFVHGDFFELAQADADANPGKGFDPEAPEKKFHAVLLDIDHSPRNLLTEKNAAFYQPEGLTKLRDKLHPGGVFALWSDDPPDEEFMASLRQVFASCESHIVTFDNPIQGGESKSTVYVATKEA